MNDHQERLAGWYWVKLKGQDQWSCLEWFAGNDVLKPHWVHGPFERVEVVGPRAIDPDEASGYRKLWSSNHASDTFHRS